MARYLGNLSIERPPSKSVDFERTGRFLKPTEAGKSGHIPIKLIVKSIIRPAASLKCYEL